MIKKITADNLIVIIAGLAGVVFVTLMAWQLQRAEASVNGAPGAGFASVDLSSFNESSSEAQFAQARTNYFYIGTYIAEQNEYDLDFWQWAPEYDILGWIDLRSIPQQAIPPSAGNTISCCLLGLSDSPILDSGWLYLGSSVNTLVADVRQIAGNLGVPPDTFVGATSISELAFMLLVSETNPRSFRYPVLPNRNLVIDANVYDIRLFNETLDVTAPYWDNIRTKIQMDYDRMRTKSLERGDELYLKWLTLQERKYRVSYTEFLGDNPDEGKRVPETTITDDFNRSDEELDSGSWNEQGADWDVSSNVAVNTSGAGTGRNSANHTTNLSGDDHYSQAYMEYTSGCCSGKYFGIQVRFADANNFYMCGAQDGFTDIPGIYKQVAGTQSVVATGTNTDYDSGATWYCEVDGSDLEVDINSGSQVITGTDTSHTGNTLVGMYNNDGAATEDLWDDFVAEDLGAGPTARRRGVLIN